MQAVEAQVRQHAKNALSIHTFCPMSLFSTGNRSLSSGGSLIGSNLLVAVEIHPQVFDDFFDFFFEVSLSLLSRHRNRCIHTIPYEAPALALSLPCSLSCYAFSRCRSLRFDS